MPRYIDADAFLLAEIERCGSQPVVGTCTMDNEYLSIRIATAPTISPDEVRGVGKWIWHDNFGWDDSIECSCCAEEFVVYDGEFPGIDSFKFCPNCGAKMKGAEDETTE